MSAQVIAVKALLGGRPTMEWGEDVLNCWEFKFQLLPVPEKAWRNQFARVVAQWAASTPKKENPEAAASQAKPKEAPWTFEVNMENPDVVVATCAPDDVKFLLLKLKTLVKRANEGHAEVVRNKQEGEEYKAAFLKEIEELKKTLDFSS
ncbi:MAG: hypothetical protein WDM80_03360 [Limisphaerales bacterium]